MESRIKVSDKMTTLCLRDNLDMGIIEDEERLPFFSAL